MMQMGYQNRLQRELVDTIMQRAHPHTASNQPHMQDRTERIGDPVGYRL